MIWTWMDYVLDFLHLVWLEISRFVRNVWARVRAPFWIYVALLTTLVVGTAVVGFGMLFVGTVTESNWMIFVGGIALIAGIVVVGIVLIPTVVVVNIVRSAIRKVGGTP